MTAAPYTEVNERWRYYDPRWWVLDVPTGQTGLVRRRWRKYGIVHYEVQFGADGPFQIRNHDQLLLATKTQVARAEGTGGEP